MTFIERRCVMK